MFSSTRRRLRLSGSRLEVMEPSNHDVVCDTAGDMAGLWQDALDDYRRALVPDLHDLYGRVVGHLERCLTSEDILDLFERSLKSLDKQRSGNQSSLRLRAVLKPLVRGLVVVLDAVAETMSSLHAPGGKGIFAVIAVLLQTASRVSDVFDDLERLFKLMSEFVERLQVRVRVPLKQSSRKIVVRALVVILKTFGSATRMLTRGRIRHFMQILFSKKNELDAALKAVEAVTSEEERMAITEVVVDMHRSSAGVDQISQDISNMNAGQAEAREEDRTLYLSRMDDMKQEIVGLRLDLATCLLEASSGRLVGFRLPPVHGFMGTEEQALMHPRLPSCRQALTGLAQFVITRFCYEDQEIMWRGLVTLLSWAIDGVNGNCNNSAHTVIVKAVDAPQILVVVVPAMFTFFLLFITWKYLIVWRPRGSSTPKIVFVDVLGKIFILEHDTFSTWEKTHLFLLDAFQNRLGDSYVRRHEYGVGDDERGLIEHESWARRIKPGAILKMSIIIREQVPRCPYCLTETTGNETVSEDGRIICEGADCGLLYGICMRRENKDSMDDWPEDGDSEFRSSQDQASEGMHTEVEDADEADNAEHSSPQDEMLSLGPVRPSNMAKKRFQRIIVELPDEITAAHSDLASPISGSTSSVPASSNTTASSAPAIVPQAEHSSENILADTVDQSLRSSFGVFTNQATLGHQTLMDEDPYAYRSPSPEVVAIMSCISVGVGPSGGTDMLARVAVVDFRGQVIVDYFVQPTMQVTDYRTATTGIQPQYLVPGRAEPIEVVRSRVRSIIRGKVLVGHSLWKDLSALGTPHPAVNTRDVGLYQPFRNALKSPNQLISLETLSWKLMRRDMQVDGQPDAVENARAALNLYRSHAADWEHAILEGRWPTVLPPSSFSRCYL
ncbi:unnamed protein product [Peniophora sp. CBMAI 1063]|nr:unnamed protein product [Peniophora sp. CBMAI 1063]